MNHAPSVVIISSQRSEHSNISFMWEISSVSCHRLITTVRVWVFIHKVFRPEGYMTMLCPLSWDHDNWRSMFIHGWYITMLCALSRDDDNWRSMIHTLGIYYLLWPLSWDDDNWQSMVHNLGMYYHVLSITNRRWQLTEHVPYMNDIYLSSDRCFETMTTDGAWFIL